jgi:hypothetical protein
MFKAAFERVTDRILTRFLDTPQGRAIKAQAIEAQETDRLANREALHAQLTTLKAAASARAIDHAPRIAAVEAEAAEKLHEYRAAVNAASELTRAYRLEVLDSDHHISQVEGELRATASPLLDEFRRELQAMVQATSDLQDSVSEKNIAGRTVTLWSNHESIVRRITEIHALRPLLEDLALEPLTDDEVAARLQDLRDSLPAVEPRPAKYYRGGEHAA